MRVLAIASAPVLGGAEVFLSRIGRELVRRGVPLALAVSDGAIALDGPWRTVAGPATPNALRRRGLGAIGISRHPAWLEWREILSNERRQGASLLILQYQAEQAALTDFARGLGFRVAWIVHSRLPFALTRALLGPGLRRAAGRADAILAVSESTRRALVAAGWPPGTLGVITPCVEVGPYAAAAGHAEHRVVVLSRLTRRKGVQVVLRAAARLRGRFPDLTVTVAGEGRYAPQLRREAARLGLGAAARFLGLVADPRPLLASGGILVHATFDKGDSIPTVLLEAGLAGLPVITTSWNGAPEVVEDGVNGLLVKPRSVRALSRALGSLLGDPALRAAMGQRGREHVLAHYTADRVAARILAAVPADPT